MPSIYTGGATAVAEQVTITPANVGIGDIFRITIGTKTVSFTATAATVANVVAGLLAAIEADDHAEFDEITWTDATTHLLGVGPDDGRPFSDGLSTSTVDGNATNTQTLTEAVTVAGTGPYDWANSANWSGSGKLVFGLYPYVPKYNLPVETDTFTDEIEIVRSEFSGLLIGLPPTSAEGYVEYLPLGIVGAPTQLDVGTGEGSFVPGINIFISATGSTVNVHSAEQRNSNGVASVQIGGDAVAALALINGPVDLARPPYQGTWGGIDFQTDSTIFVGSRGDLFISEYVSARTATTIQSGGRVVDESTDNATTFIVRGGATLILDGDSFLLALLTVEIGGTVIANRPFVISECHCSGSIDLSRDARASKTFTTLDLYAGCNFQDPNKVGTYTAGIDCNRFTPNVEGIVNVGADVRLTVGSPA